MSLAFDMSFIYPNGVIQEVLLPLGKISLENKNGKLSGRSHLISIQPAQVVGF
jgi:hypothetical protein